MTTALLGQAPVTPFRIATAGSADDEKSTLVGRLLHDPKTILTDQLDAVTRPSKERGFGGAAAGCGRSADRRRGHATCAAQ